MRQVSIAHMRERIADGRRKWLAAMEAAEAMAGAAEIDAAGFRAIADRVAEAGVQTDRVAEAALLIRERLAAVAELAVAGGHDGALAEAEAAEAWVRGAWDQGGDLLVRVYDRSGGAR